MATDRNDQEKEFLARMKRHDKAYQRAKTVEADQGFLEAKDYVAAYPGKKKGAKWNEEAKITGVRFGVADGAKYKGAYISIGWIYKTGPLKGRSDSDFLNLEPMEGQDDTEEELLENACAAIQKAGIKTADTENIADLVEAAKEYNELPASEKTTLKINMQYNTYKAKRANADKGIKKGDEVPVVNKYLGAAVVAANEVPSDEDTDDQDDDGGDTDAKDGDDTDGFFVGDIVAYKPPRKRKALDFEVADTTEHDDGSVTYNLVSVDDEDVTYDDVAEDKLTLVREAE